MPVRSLNSSVFKWPDAQIVDRAARRWAQAIGRDHDDVWRIGYFGSYARGDWGVGSDLDFVIIVEQAEHPFASRALDWDVFGLPVPTDVLVYTRSEWQAMARENRRFFQTIADEAVWVYTRQSAGSTTPISSDSMLER